MRSFLSIVVCCLCLAANTFAQQAKHVIIVTVDGFRPDFYLDPSWGAVNIRQLMSEGVYSQGVNSVFPSVTYPSHTTIVTGVKPAKHGIYYNNPFEPAGPTGKWYWEANNIKVPTLWDAAHDAHMVTASLCWPVTVGASSIDYNVPEIFPLTGVSADRRPLASQDATPKGLFEELQQNATGKLSMNDFTLAHDRVEMDNNVARMCAYLIRTYKPGLTTVHIACVDHAEHEEGRDGPQVRRAVASADRAIRTIMEAVEDAGIKDSTAIIVTGDHGFVDIHSILCPNVWLAQAGLLNDAKSGDWKAQFYTSGGSTFLFLKDPKDTKTLQQVKDILAKVPASYQRLFRVIDGEEMKRIGADPNAALALTAEQGICFGPAKDADKLIMNWPGLKGMHGYFPDFKEIRTGFVGAGAGFNKGGVVPEMGLEDIAPIVAKLLGLSFKSADGILYPGIVK
jgi:predicted AlkP superfamily pyrophosphatase or phosphodiesterase